MKSTTTFVSALALVALSSSVQAVAAAVSRSTMHPIELACVAEDPQTAHVHADPAINPHTGQHDPDSGAELIGQPAPAWTFDRWARGGPLTLTELKGKVVLVRWWTDGCHFCRKTLPVLEALRREHPND